MNPERALTSHRLLSPTERQQLRQTLRQRRKAVPTTARKSTALRIARSLRFIVRPNARIAIYAAFDGELDLSPFATQARRAQCTLFAPVIVDKQQRRMEFVRVAAPLTSQPNDFGIREPRDTPLRRIHPRNLDVILMPVVAFDAHGWRLGFGGGYYDRKLHFKRRSALRKPLLIGIGYEFQRVTPVVASHWDIKLDLVVTERGVHRCR